MFFMLWFVRVGNRSWIFVLSNEVERLCIMDYRDDDVDVVLEYFVIVFLIFV